MVGLLWVFLAACGSDDSPDGPPASPPAGTPTPSEATGNPGGTAEDALYFFPPQQGATLSYTNSGAASGASDVTVDSVSSGDAGQTVSVTEVVSGGGDPVTVERTFVTAPDGGLVIGAESFAASAPGMEVTAVGDDVLIPSISALEAGETSSGATFVELAGAGLTMRNEVSYEVAGGGFGEVTVPAGAADAYVVELTLNVDSSVAGSQQGVIQYWFVPGFGMVRQEATIAGFGTTSELDSSSVPLP